MQRTLTLPSSTSPSRLLINITRHPRHLPHFPVLRKISTSLRPCTGAARSDNSDIQYRRFRLARSEGRIFWHLYPTRRWSIPLQSERHRSGRLGASRSGSIESDMGGFNLQGQHRLSLPYVSPLFPLQYLYDPPSTSYLPIVLPALSPSSSPS